MGEGGEVGRECMVKVHGGNMVHGAEKQQCKVAVQVQAGGRN